MQSSDGQGLTRRWSSWYDSQIVTRDGEDVLAKIDDDAIRVLRAHKLTWSSWASGKPDFLDLGLADRGWTFREIPLGVEGHTVHRFALSVIWRAAVSRLRDLSYFALEAPKVEALRLAILDPAPPPLELFPTSVVQISTEGARHNLTPTIGEKTLINPDGSLGRKIVMVRMFMDGLVFHSHFDPIEFSTLQDNKLILGSHDTVAVPAVTFEASFARDNFFALAFGSLPSNPDK